MRCTKCGKKITESYGTGKDKVWECSSCGSEYAYRKGKCVRL
jgi:predicted RNA-binding Zn-ribbon protein involved in translation (DUF1610 family)